MNRARYNRIYNEVARREISEHLGRSCTLNMKNGDVLKVVRTGYGAMERPEWDNHEIYKGDELVCKGSYSECISYINDNY